MGAVRPCSSGCLRVALGCPSRYNAGMAKKLSDPSDPLIVQHIGKQFGAIVAVKFSHIQHDQIWEFECGCGKHFLARLAAVKNGHTRSCGCLLKDVLIRRNTTHGYAARDKQSHIYRVWKSMRKRCNNPKSKDFRLYGGKGVKVCSRWQDFKNFHDDMAASYQPGLEIERLDSNGDYSPENCKWGTEREQALNTNRAHLVTFRGETLNLSLWAERFGLAYELLRQRLKAGWSMEESISRPSRRA